MNNNSFRERLAELMEERSINTIALSKEIGYSNSVISRWLKKEIYPKLQTIKILADYFGCSVDYLAGRSEIFVGESSAGNADFVEQVQFLLKEKRVSAYKAAKIISIDRSLFSKWKTGQAPTLIMLIKLADYFNCSIDFLIGRSGS